MLVIGSTPLIVVGLEGYPEPIWPVTLYDLYRYFPNVMFGTQQQEEVLVPFGIFPIHPGDKPTGDVVTPVTPILVDGQYVQQYTVRDFTPEEIAENLANARANALMSLDSVLSTTYDRGFTYNHNGDEENFSMTADMRQLFIGKYLLASQETDTTRKFKMRTVDNRTIEFTVDEMKALGKAVMEYVSAVLDKLWAYMDQITGATVITDIPAIPDYIDLTA